VGRKHVRNPCCHNQQPKPSLVAFITHSSRSNLSLKVGNRPLRPRVVWRLLRMAGKKTPTENQSTKTYSSMFSRGCTIWKKVRIPKIQNYSEGGGGSQ
jgi:hypothetical protein